MILLSLLTAAGDVDQSLTAWIPGSVLGAAAIFFGRLWTVQLFKRLEALELKAAGAISAEQFSTLMSKLDRLDTDLQQVAVKLAGAATNDGLGRMGDRMDSRITNVTERVAVLEATAGRPARKR